MAKSKSAPPKSAPGVKSADEAIVSLRRAAIELGMDPGRLSKEAKRRGFPWRICGKTRGVVVNELSAWRAHNIRQRKTAPTPAKSARAAAWVTERASEKNVPPAEIPLPPREDNLPAATPGNAAPFGEGSGYIETMISGKGTAIEISRAAMQIASREVGKSAAAGILNTQDLDGLKKVLGELRQAEADYIELEKSRGLLIERTDVDAIVGMCCARLVRALSILENSIATEFSMWLADPKIAAMPADERTRMVREFVAKTAREVRQQEADGVQALLDQAESEAQ